jgi:hypothetical protein
MDMDEVTQALQSAGIMMMNGNGSDAMKREALQVHLGQLKLTARVRSNKSWLLLFFGY